MSTIAGESLNYFDMASAEAGAMGSNYGAQGKEHLVRVF
jgi:hypothetical protein